MHQNEVSRGDLIATLGAAAVGTTLLGGCAGAAAEFGRSADLAAPYRAPYKYGELVLRARGEPGTFDEKAVDQPFVFEHEGRFFMTFVGWDGKGYQTLVRRARRTAFTPTSRRSSMTRVACIIITAR